MVVFIYAQTQVDAVLPTTHFLCFRTEIICIVHCSQHESGLLVDTMFQPSEHLVYKSVCHLSS